MRFDFRWLAILLLPFLLNVYFKALGMFVGVVPNAIDSFAAGFAGFFSLIGWVVLVAWLIEVPNHPRLTLFLGKSKDGDDK